MKDSALFSKKILYILPKVWFYKPKSHLHPTILYRPFAHSQLGERERWAICITLDDAMRLCALLTGWLDALVVGDVIKIWIPECSFFLRLAFVFPRDCHNNEREQKKKVNIISIHTARRARDHIPSVRCHDGWCLFESGKNVQSLFFFREISLNCGEVF